MRSAQEISLLVHLQQSAIRLIQVLARVEHVFACFATSMGGKFTSKIGL